MSSSATRPGFVLSRPAPLDEPRRPAMPSVTSITSTRPVRVLQSSRAPAQLSLFLRPGAIDVK